MTVEKILASATVNSLDAEVLLSALLNTSRTWLIAHPDALISDRQTAQFRTWDRRRASGEPVAYLTGQKEFFGRTFHVTRDVLIPRPSTELLVEHALAGLSGLALPTITPVDTDIVAWHHRTAPWDTIRTIADIGTGSGCIAITIACERPDVSVIANDIAENALRIARKNARKHHVTERITMHAGDCLEVLRRMHDPYIIVSNPPYIPIATMLDADVAAYEPHQALFAGKDGLDVLQRLVAAARKDPLCHGWLLECMHHQITHLSV